MSHEEQQQALEAVKRKYGRCPNCGSPDAELTDIIGLPIMERAIPSGIGLGDQVFPVLPVTCVGCKHITLFQGKEFVRRD